MYTRQLLKRGAASLSDAELLAVLLHTGYRDCSALNMARALLREFGGIGGLLRADQDSLLSCPGVGPAKYSRLRAAFETVSRQALEEVSAGSVLNTPTETRGFLKTHLGSRTREDFPILFLDRPTRGTAVVTCCAQARCEVPW